MSAQVTSSQGISCGWERLNRQKCESMLRNVPEFQRSVKMSNLNKLKSSISEGDFIQNGEPIIISADGYLIDGQHRVRAFLDMDFFPEVLIVRDVSETQAYGTIDIGTSRSLGDVFKSKGIPNYIINSSITKNLLELVEMRIGSANNHAAKIVQFYRDNAVVISKWNATYGTMNSIISQTQRGAFLSYLEITHGRDEAKVFIETLETGIGPITYCSLRKMLIKDSNKPRGKMSYRQVLHVCCKAAKRHLESGEQLKHIRFDGEFPYLVQRKVVLS